MVSPLWLMAKRQRSRLDDRIAIAELRGVLDFDRDARVLLDDVLADQARVPARAATEDHDALGRAQLVVGEIQTAQLGDALVVDQAAAHAVADGLGLLVDLLQHEVIEAALFDLLEIPVDLVDLLVGRDVVDGLGDETVAAHRHHLVVVEIDDLLRVLQDGGHVGGEEVLVARDADDERRAVAHADDLVGLLLAHDDEPVGAFELRHGQTHRFLQRTGGLVELLHQVRDDLGVGLGREEVAFLDEALLQRGIVFDDAVVHDGDVAGAVGVRVRVFGVGFAVGGPARVRHADRPLPRAQADQAFELRDLTLGLLDGEVAVLHDGHTGGVVAAVFEALQPLEEDRHRRVVSDVPDDSAHW